MRRLSPTTALAARVGTISLILALVYYTTKSQSAKVQITSLTRETQLCNHVSLLPDVFQHSRAHVLDLLI